MRWCTYSVHFAYYYYHVSKWEQLPTPVFWPGKFHGLHRDTKRRTQMSDFHTQTYISWTRLSCGLGHKRTSGEAVYLFPPQTWPHSPGPFSPPLLSKVFEKKAGPTIWSVTKWTLHSLHFLIHKEEIIIITNNFMCQTLSWEQSTYSLV